MKLLVAISSYRVADLTIDCLRSLRAEVERIPGTRVAVCENGSGGNEADRLRRAIKVNEWGSWADLIVVHPNQGFTGGTNAAIRPALEADDPPEYVLLLNADTVVQEDALGALVAFMDHHLQAGIAGSRLLWPDGKVGASPFRFPGIANELDRGLQLGIASRLLRRWSILMPTPEAPCRADWVSGASMILRRAMLDRIGLLDEGFFTYCDDVDICHRARRTGWETWHVPQSRIIHLVGCSTGVTGRGPRPSAPRLLARGAPTLFPEAPRALLRGRR